MGEGLRKKEKKKATESGGLSRDTHTRTHTLSRHTKKKKRKKKERQKKGGQITHEFTASSFPG